MISKKVIFFSLLCIAILAIGVVLVLRQKEKLTLTPPVPPPLRYSVYYANWAQFWPGGPTDSMGIVNSPATMDLTNVDTIIYGVVMFGVMGNPLLQCYQSGGSCVTSNCFFYPPNWVQPVVTNVESIGKNIWGDFSQNILTDIDNAVVNGTLFGTGQQKIDIETALTSTVTAGTDYANKLQMAINNGTPHPPNPTVFIDSGTLMTFPTYPSYCFTGCENPPIAGTCGIKSCCSNGRISDPDCFAQLNSIAGTLVGNSPKLIASYGGWTWTNGGAQFSDISQPMFTNMVSSRQTRAEFIAGSYNLLSIWGFQGADFDWEYPGSTGAGGSASDFYNLACFFSEFHSAYPEFHLSMQCSGFLSSDARYASIPWPSGNIKLDTMQNTADYFAWINLMLNNGLTSVNFMAYDFYVAGGQDWVMPSTPLYSPTNPNPSIIGTDLSYEIFVPTPTTGATESFTQNPPIKYVTAYNIVSGDIPTVIAAKLYCNYLDLLAANPNVNWSTLQIGSQIRIPGSGIAICGTYKVKAGDSASVIGDANGGISSGWIKISNPQINWTTLPLGAVVNIPCVGNSYQPTPLPPAVFSTYTVVSGDSAWAIANNYKSTVDDLKLANPQANMNNLAIGQILNIPGTSQPVCKIYTVANGDTLSTISLDFGCTIAQLSAINPQANMNNLAIGQPLNIPCVVAPVTPAVAPVTPTVAPVTPTVQPSTYTVVSGDTSAKIASKLKCAQSDLSLANPTVIWNNLQIGQILNIPLAPAPVVITPAPVGGVYPDFRTLGNIKATEPTVGYSIVGSLEAMKSAMGANISRVHLGLAFYGRSYANVNFMGLTGQALVDNIIGLPSGGAAPAGPYTSASGVLSYYEIFGGYSTTGYNAKYGVNVAYDIDQAQAVIYDGPEAIAAKMAIAKSYGLAGVMTFTPSQDNFGSGPKLAKVVQTNL